MHPKLPDQCDAKVVLKNGQKAIIPGFGSGVAKMLHEGCKDGANGIGNLTLFGHSESGGKQCPVDYVKFRIKEILEVEGDAN